MELDPTRWHRLTPDNIAALPNKDGVFEIANLVRNVQYVARACGRLRDTVAAMGHMPKNLPLSVGGYFFRFELTTAEGDAFRRRLESYRKRHDGSLPPGNSLDQVMDEPMAAMPTPAPVNHPVEAQQAA
jgi:hypothetical protein